MGAFRIMTVRIFLHLYATLKSYTPPGGDGLAIAAGTTVRAVLEQLGAPTDQAKLIFINGVRRSMETPLYGGERVGIFPPVGGG